LGNRYSIGLAATALGMASLSWADATSISPPAPRELDLVTLPAPFLDTACPDGWRAALALIAAVPFSTAIPGHGAPLVRAQFSIYRQAFDSFVACSNSARLKDECAAAWAHDAGPLLTDDPRQTQSAQAAAAYYVDLLRANGGRSKYCEEPLA
jgi:hypothetical protein